MNQDKRKRLNKLRKISETMIVNETYKLIGSNQTITFFKEDIKYSSTPKEGLEKKCI